MRHFCQHSSHSRCREDNEISSIVSYRDDIAICTAHKSTLRHRVCLKYLWNVSHSYFDSKLQEFCTKIMSILGCTIEQLLLLFLILWWMASETMLRTGTHPSWMFRWSGTSTTCLGEERTWCHPRSLSNVWVERVLGDYNFRMNLSWQSSVDI